MTKKQLHSISTIKRMLEIVEDDVALELKRYSQKRHKNINKAFETIRLHLTKLDIETAHLKSLIGVYYSAENNKKYFEGLKRIVESSDIFKE